MAIGRPRAFDTEKALDSALKVFWQKGYEGASLPDLTKAMGINRPSLYAAFGNKEELFRKVLDRYTAQSGAFIREVLNDPSARTATEKLLNGIIDSSLCPKTPKGCLLVQGALACGKDAEPVRQELIARRGKIEILLRKRYEQAIAEGELPKNTSAADLACFIATVIHGIAVQNSSGSSHEALRGIADITMNAWPSPQNSKKGPRFPSLF